MTINIAISVNEGLVMAADSLSQVCSGDDVDSIHQSVEKITEIRARPIAVMINGLDEIDRRTIISLIREFEFHQYQKPMAPIRTWPVLEMSSQLKVFIGKKYDEAYGPAKEKPDLGVIVGGYSPGSFFPELFELDFAKNSLRTVVPTKVGEPPTGEERIEYWGKRGALDRLYWGFDKGLVPVTLTILRVWQRCVDLGVAPADLPEQQYTNLMEEARQAQTPEDEAFLERLKQVAPQMAMRTRLRGMPLQEAVEFADYLGQTAIGYDRFCRGNPAVGGELDVVAIQPDGLHWYRRKGFLKEMARARERSVLNDERERIRDMTSSAMLQMASQTGKDPIDVKKLVELMGLFGFKPPAMAKDEPSADKLTDAEDEPGKA